ncbi:GtrA family protein [Thalassobaculum sp.]|uniref:GtrA family protein n=1 Tax=Thalassobaculum sp. TaxID=2022740 RepID=UPI0032ED9D08
MNGGAVFLLRQFLGFATVGIVGLVAHYSALTGLVELGGVDPVMASVIGFLAGALVNYVLNRQLVFRSDRAHRSAGPKFLAVAASGLVLNGALMALLVDHLGVFYLAAQVMVTGGLVFWHFVLNKFWTFRG